VSDQELLQAVQENAAEAQRFRADAERALDRLADPRYGFTGEATEEQARNREVAVLNSLRLSLAHRKAGASVPSLPMLLSRARLAADPTYSPGKRGQTRQFVEPVNQFRSIHEAAAFNPF